MYLFVYLFGCGPHPHHPSLLSELHKRGNLAVSSRLVVSLPQAAGHPHPHTWDLPCLETPRTQTSSLSCQLPPVSLAQSLSTAAAASLSPSWGLLGSIKQPFWSSGLESEGLGPCPSRCQVPEAQGILFD